MGPAFGGVMSNHVAEQLFPGSQVPRPSAGGGDLSEGDPTIASRPADTAELIGYLAGRSIDDSDFRTPHFRPHFTGRGIGSKLRGSVPSLRWRKKDNARVSPSLSMVLFNFCWCPVAEYLSRCNG